MAKHNQDNQKGINTKHPKKRLRSIAIIITVCIGLLLLFITQYKTAEQRLAAIDATRTIPDAENAAILYNQLRKDYNDIDLPFHFVYPSDPARMRPWFSKELPEIAKWYEERQEITARLLQINKYEKCWFPIPKSKEDFFTTTDLLRTMRVMAVYLIRLANNDIAENRIDEGLEKYFCAIGICRHTRQQPFTVFFTHGITFESLALTRMRYCILYSDLTEEHLQTIKKALTQSDAEQTHNWENMIKVENLYAKQTPLLDRLKRRLQNRRNQRSTLDLAHEIRTRVLADRHGNHILILLRKYKDKTGYWPQSLDELQPLADEEIFIDPQNNCSFFYKTTEEDFILYGKGPNKIDEGGRFHRDGGDDWLIWPPKGYKTQVKNTNKK